uniref:EGF-like domain-containing protein n=1 Tax=Picea sitchensis TaxID=3332 RepID=C0PQ34_PICSI|nr:unknown [Picea sitchensis]
MSSLQNFKYSWQLTIVILILVAFISVVHVFFVPLIPTSLEFTGSRQTESLADASSVKNGSSTGDKNIEQDQYPQSSDSYGAILYRDAPWKADMGKWLSRCHDIAALVYINETISGKNCKDGCSGHGICNVELGECRCFHGYAGEGCSEKLNIECNTLASPEAPFGYWMVSICSAYCDTTRAMCFCGEGSKYPDRPVAESCGFQVNGQVVNWSIADSEIIYTNDISKPGWCNVNPQEVKEGKALYKHECDCKYDCQWGQFCEIPTECSCINQCSGNGCCHGGFCQCKDGWYGVDCSIPSISSPLKEWPQWLRSATVHLPDGRLGDDYHSIRAVVKKKRPLIYIYDLPPEFNIHLLEGRHFRFQCVNRIYDDRNKSLWTDQLYGSQMALYESLLASPYRTLNGEEADYFYVPVLDACLITRADDAPHLSMKNHMGLRSYLTLDFYKKAYDHIMEHYTYWNRSSGHDHIWFFAWDEGACYAPKEIWNSMMLVHWGNTNSKHNHSTTAYLADNWDHIPIERRGRHPCFDPEKDLVLPAWKRPDPYNVKARFWARSRRERFTLFYFNGNLGASFKNNRPEPTYSLGIRQKLAAEFASEPNKEGKFGRQSTKDVIVVSQKSPNYYSELGSSLFCGVFPGDGWSGRMEDSVLQGCIPVIIQDGIQVAYENVLNYDSFAVRIAEDDIPHLVQILRGINETELEFKLANVQKLRQRFIYRDSVMLEARRQNKSHGHVDDWALQYSLLTGDDVLSTFIQVLHYKLHNDPWRSKLSVTKKEFGLPPLCQKNRNTGSSN